MEPGNFSYPICQPQHLDWLLDQNVSLSLALRGAIFAVMNNVSKQEIINCTYTDDDLIYATPVGKTVLFIFLGCLAFIGNSIVFVSLYRKRNRLSRVSYFIMHLALADLIVVAMHVPMDLIWEALFFWYAGNFLCKVLMFLRNVGLYLSAFILVSISVDRVLAITRPLSLLKAENSRCAICGFRRGKLMLLASWWLSFLCSAPQVSARELRTARVWIEDCASGLGIGDCAHLDLGLHACGLGTEDCARQDWGLRTLLSFVCSKGFKLERGLIERLQE